MADPKFHPALAVANIRNAIPITLQIEKSQYSSWAELFKIHCEANLVIDHIMPPTSSDNPVSADPQWRHLDAVVLQWLYGTISEDLRETVIKPGASAHEIWNRLEGIFQDNKNQRALYLEHQFSNLKLDEFPNASAYCQELKSLSDQLANVGSEVSNQRLVLQLVSGLNDNYEGLATMISQSNPLPPFYEARSRLVMEETRKGKKVGSSSVDSALHTNSANPSSGNNSRSSGGPKRGNATAPNAYGNSQQSGRNNRSSGKPRNNVTGNSVSSPQQVQSFNSGQRPPHNPMQRPFNPWSFSQSAWAWAPWAYPPPPCPYPTTGWARPGSQQPGILGPRPQQAFAAQCPVPQQQNPQATDIDAAMHTLALPVPDDNWIFDTGATSHMTSNDGYTNGNDTYEMY